MSNVSQEVNINLDLVWEPAAVGLRRASTFSGLGTNAARDPNLTDFHLPGLLKLSFFKEDASKLGEVKEQFERWILSNAFREVLESFAISLDRSYEVLLFVESVRKHQEVSRKRFNSFHYAGLEGKLERLNTEFGVHAKVADYLAPLSKARNCLAHRMGVVGIADCTEPGILKVRYRRIETLFLPEKGGPEQIVPADSADSFVTEGAGHIAIRFKEAETEFPLGARLVLEPIDVKYIFWTVNQSGIELKQALLEKLREMGVLVKQKGEATIGCQATD